MNDPTFPPRRSSAAVRAVVAISEFILACEKVLIGTFMAVLLVLILLNVVTRSIGAPLYWVDEAAVYAMVWLAFIGASALTRLRLDFTITLLADQLSPENVRRLRALANAIGVAFGIALTVMCWLWMDPLGIAAANFDAKAYAGTTFNFLYTEHTQTLGWPTWLVSLVVPLFGVTMTIHLLANLLEDMKLSPVIARPEFSSAEAMN